MWNAWGMLIMFGYVFHNKNFHMIFWAFHCVGHFKSSFAKYFWDLHLTRRQDFLKARFALFILTKTLIFCTQLIIEQSIWGTWQYKYLFMTSYTWICLLCDIFAFSKMLQRYKNIQLQLYLSRMVCIFCSKYHVKDCCDTIWDGQ